MFETKTAAVDKAVQQGLIVYGLQPDKTKEKKSSEKLVYGLVYGFSVRFDNTIKIQLKNQLT